MAGHHPDHTAELNRIKRIMGQLDGIRRMIEDGRYCGDILTQVKAVHSALRGLESSVLTRHLQHCVRDAFASDDQAAADARVEEIVQLFRRHTD